MEIWRASELQTKPHRATKEEEKARSVPIRHTIFSCAADDRSSNCLRHFNRPSRRSLLQNPPNVRRPSIFPAPLLDAHYLRHRQFSSIICPPISLRLPTYVTCLCPRQHPLRCGIRTTSHAISLSLVGEIIDMTTVEVVPDTSATADSPAADTSATVDSPAEE